jgi:hypothetical protein
LGRIKFSIDRNHKEKNKGREQIQPQRENITHPATIDVFPGEKAWFEQQRNQTAKEFGIECKIIAKEIS